MFVIYRIRNTKTGQSYIGQTRRGLLDRMTGHARAAERGETWPISVAIRQCGLDAFEVTTLCHARARAEADSLEREAIRFYRTMTPEGYNVSFGGTGSHIRTLGQRLAVSLTKRGKPGKKPTVASLQKQIEARTGARNWRARSVAYQGVSYACINDACAATGLTKSQFMRRLKLGTAVYLTPPRANTSRGTTNRGRHHSDAAKAKMSVARRGSKNWNARAIELDGVVYPSRVEATAATGLSKRKIATRIQHGTARYLTDARHILKEQNT
jgi:hypothetical protein